MSLRCLKDSLSAVGIPDELESFLHVLIYNSIRFLIHDASSTQGFIETYFDGYSRVAAGVSASATKNAVMELGELRYDRKKIVFRLPNGGPHPINKVIEELLRIFKARYEVLDYEANMAAYEARQRAHPLPSLLEIISEEGLAPEEEESETLRYYDPDAAAVYESMVQSEPEETSSDKTPPPERPSDKTFTLAASLESHTMFIMTLQRHINKRDVEWPLHDRKAVDTLKDYVAPRWACPYKGNSNTASELTDAFFSGETPASASQQPATGGRVASRS